MVEDTSLEGTLVDLDFVSRVRPLDGRRRPGASDDAGSHSVRNAVQSVIEVLVTGAALAELGEDSKSPSTIHQPNEETGFLGAIHIDHSAWVGDMRAALRAGRRPATAPMRIAAPNPPPQASTGTTTDHPLVEA